MLKCEQNLLILSFKEEITEVPAGCASSYNFMQWETINPTA